MQEELLRALDSLMRYLAARDHSEFELRNKLKRRYEPEIIEQTIAFAKQRALLPPPEQLAEQEMRELSRRKKSHGYIQNKLRSKGLPVPPCDTNEEMEKMRRLLQNKFGENALGFETKTKALRFLSYRGFNPSLISKVLNEKNEE